MTKLMFRGEKNNLVFFPLNYCSLFFSTVFPSFTKENQRKASILQQGQTNGISRGQFLSLEFLVESNESKLVTFQLRTCAGLLEIVCVCVCVCVEIPEQNCYIVRLLDHEILGRKCVLMNVSIRLSAQENNKYSIKRMR